MTPLEWFSDKQDAIAHRDMYAKILKGLGMTGSHAAGIEAFEGGYRVYVRRRD